MVSGDDSEVSNDLPAKVPIESRFLRIPPIAFVLGELGLRGAAGFSQ